MRLPPRKTNRNKAVITPEKIIRFPIVPYAFAITLVLCGNTLPALLPGRGTKIYLAALFICAFVTVALWLKRPLLKSVLRNWIVWILLVSISYLLILFITGDGSGVYGICAFAFLAICPLMIALLHKSELLELYLRSYVNIMMILALISLVLWVLGPIMGILATNCRIDNYWNGLGIKLSSSGYYNLLYITQTDVLFGDIVIRNTGIFAESPMYSYALCVALLFERYFSGKPRSIPTAILAICVVTTFSTTGITFLLGVVFVEAVRKTLHLESHFKMVVFIILFAAFVGAAFVAIWLLDAKLGSSSGSTRLDDFSAGFQAWQKQPILGYGLSDTETVTKYMSGFRSMNQGFSNSLFDVLVRGGLVFLLPFIVAFAGFMNLPNRQKLAALFFAYLWIITIVTFQPVTFLVFGIGVVGFMYGKDANDPVFSSVKDSVRLGVYG